MVRKNYAFRGTDHRNTHATAIGGEALATLKMERTVRGGPGVRNPFVALATRKAESCKLLMCNILDICPFS